MNHRIFTPLRKTRLFIGVCLLLTIFSAKAQNYSWVKQYEGAPRLNGRDVASAPSGDNYVRADFQGTVVVDGQELSAATSGQLLAKHDGAGTLKWVLPMKGVIVSSMKATEDHVYLSGYYNREGAYIATHSFDDAGENYNGFIVRLTENGVVDLVVNLAANDPDRHDMISDMDVDASGRMYITGTAAENAVLAGDTLDNAGRPMFIARIEQNGSIGWVTTANTTGGLGITTSKNGNKIFVSAQAGDADVVNFDNSTVIYTHTSDGNPFGGFFMMSLDNSGEVLQTKMLLSSRFRVGNPMIEVSDENDLYVVMNHQYASEVIMKFDTLLQKMWEFNEPSRDAAIHSIAVDVSGNLLIAGSVQGEAVFSGTQLSGEGNWSGFVAKYDNNGNLMWVTGLINNSVEEGAMLWGVDSDSHTDVYVAGAFSVPVNLPGYGTKSPMVPGNTDMLLARIQGLSNYDGLAEHKSGRLLLYPSVNNGTFKISHEGKSGKCSITDISGRCVYESQLPVSQSVLDVNCKLADGVYFVNVVHSDGQLSQGKMVVRN